VSDGGLHALLGSIDNALRTGSYMTNANLAMAELCRIWKIDREALSFDPMWARYHDYGSDGSANVIVLDDHDDPAAYVLSGKGHYMADAWWENGALVIRLNYHDVVRHVAADQQEYLHRHHH
jgi:hypothetical protein